MERIEQGNCPKCGSTNLEYGDEIRDSGAISESIEYPYVCCGCSFEGREIYSISFCGHIDSETDEFYPM